MSAAVLADGARVGFFVPLALRVLRAEALAVDPPSDYVRRALLYGDAMKRAVPTADRWRSCTSGGVVVSNIVVDTNPRNLS